MSGAATRPATRDLYRHTVALTSGRTVDVLSDGERLYTLRGGAPGVDVTAIVAVSDRDYVLAAYARLAAQDAIPYLQGDADAVCQAAEPARRARRVA